MDINYVELLKWIAIIALGGLSIYLKNYTKVVTLCDKYIDLAEKEYKDVAKSGDLKMKWCVDQINKVIPTTLKPILTDSLIEQIVQNAFDEIEHYAKIQIKKATDELNKHVDEVDKRLESELNK